MRFKSQKYHNSIPTIDLIPMLNVMMSVLAFFILVSMSLTTGPQGVKVDLPGDGKDTEIPIDKPSKNLIVTLKYDDSFSVSDYDQKIQTIDQLKVIVQNHLTNQETGTVLLMADKTVSYKKIIGTLIELKQIEENRISLAITTENDAP
ncbi:ExbD/TolR family protein [Crocosphaera sp. Alani8]|uniref:ExbD/TolR family protein n=1 Tax=Crocosphaera sp. Alani8 TaxID=3038952 RepID=UPI00313CB8E4